jgi:integrase
MKLDNKIVNNASPKLKPYKLSDGAGLYLYVMPTGKKYWRVKYRYAGCEKVFSIGVYPEISLKSARIACAEMRSQLAQNLDPNALKKEAKERIVILRENTFENVTNEWYAKNSNTWNDKYKKRILKGLESNLLPRLGCKPIEGITALELLKTLRIIENRSIGTAHRMLQTCSQIFRYAIATGKVEIDVTLSLKGALSKVSEKHYSYLTEKELFAFLTKTNTFFAGKLQKLALNLLILTFTRSTELRAAKWEEIDWDKSEWRIPAERMKMKSLHIVPLSSQAIKVLRELQVISGNREYIFPAERNPDTHISENILLHLIYDMGYKGKTTVHGFRATASTILNENGFPPDVIERQLAHTERNKVRASYNHAQYLSERRNMMNWWGSYIDQKNGKNIIQIKRA